MSLIVTDDVISRIARGRPASFCDWVYCWQWQMIVNFVQPVLSWTFRRIQLGAWKVQSAKTSQRSGYSCFCGCLFWQCPHNIEVL
jgi:hypothetical protein